MSHVNKMLQLRLDFWFSLSRSQKRKLDDMNYSHMFCEEILVEDFVKVSKSKKILEQLKELKELKRQSFRLVA